VADDSWYRNLDWNDEIEATFRAKLARSRSQRPQYLEKQAGALADRHPLISLGLIEEYFDTGDQFFVPAAYCHRARASLTLGRIADAISAYKSALDWEAEHPGFYTTARIQLPKLVAEERVTEEYDYALSILTSRFSPGDHRFPDVRYDWNGTCALIAFEQGIVAEAKEFAERALRAADERQSPFPRHRDVGLVKNTSDEFGRRIKKIARGSNVRAALWNVLRIRQ
jgi:tetratricopeptide (TPR) repeat protein